MPSYNSDECFSGLSTISIDYINPRATTLNGLFLGSDISAVFKTTLAWDDETYASNMNRLIQESYLVGDSVQFDFQNRLPQRDSTGNSTRWVKVEE